MANSLACMHTHSVREDIVLAQFHPFICGCWEMSTIPARRNNIQRDPQKKPSTLDCKLCATSSSICCLPPPICFPKSQCLCWERPNRGDFMCLCVCVFVCGRSSTPQRLYATFRILCKIRTFRAKRALRIDRFILSTSSIRYNIYTISLHQRTDGLLTYIRLLRMHFSCKFPFAYTKWNCLC